MKIQALSNPSIEYDSEEPTSALSFTQRLYLACKRYKKFDSLTQAEQWLEGILEKQELKMGESRILQRVFFRAFQSTYLEDNQEALEKEGRDAVMEVIDRDSDTQIFLRVSNTSDSVKAIELAVYEKGELIDQEVKMLRHGSPR